MNNINKNYKILIVEDEPLLLRSIVLKLDDEGFCILKAEDGEKGLEVALTEHPDLILLDVVMPKMDGIQVLQRLRQDDWGKDAKVILLTNLSDSTRVAQAMSFGVFEYLTKTDWNLEDIVSKIYKHLSIK